MLNPLAVKAYDEQVKTLRRQFAILGADKGASTYVLICKSHLARQMMEEATTTKTYENPETQEIKVIVGKREKYVVREQRLAEHQQQDEHGNDILPSTESSSRGFLCLHQTSQKEHPTLHGKIACHQTPAALAMDNQNTGQRKSGKLVFGCRNRHGRELGHQKQCQSEGENEENIPKMFQFEKKTNVRLLSNVRHAGSARNEEENDSLRGLGLRAHEMECHRIARSKKMR